MHEKLKMKPIAFIVDSSLINNEQPLPLDHYLVELPITEEINGKTIEHTTKNPISFAQIKQKCVQGVKLRTSGIIVGECHDLLVDLLKKYQKIVICGISNQLSSSYQSWKLLEKEFEPNRIRLLNNIILGSNFFIHSQKLWRCASSQTSWKQVEEMLEPCANFQGILLVQDITCLAQGGRINAFSAMLGKTLKVKVLINYQNGKLDFYDKQFSKKKSFESLVHYVKDQLKVDFNQPNELNLWSTFVDQELFAAELKDLQEYFPQTKFHIQECPKPVMVHVGINSLAITLTI